MTIEPKFESAFRSSDRVGELRKIAQRLLDEGQPSAAVLRRFDHLRQQLRAAGREEEEDAVMDVMDFLTGWCSPHVKLSSESASQTSQE
jgi:hypothetical protein